VPKDTISWYAFSFLQALSLSLKHRAFLEEREWRIVYRPNQYPNGKLRKIVESVKGIPQKIYVLDLKNIPEENFFGVEIPELIDRILIGPNEHPLAMRQAFVHELSIAGVPNPERKIHITAIPLRQ
jgi:hypothetical protein